SNIIRPATGAILQLAVDPGVNLVPVGVIAVYDRIPERVLAAQETVIAIVGVECQVRGRFDALLLADEIAVCIVRETDSGLRSVTFGPDLLYHLITEVVMPGDRVPRLSPA